MFDNVTLKLNADPLIISALKEDITSEDVSTNSVMPEPKKGEVAYMQAGWNHMWTSDICKGIHTS